MEIIENGNRFFLINDMSEKVGEVDFERQDNKLIIIHTEVQKTLRKDGFGESLVMKVVEKAKENNLKIGATCPYAVNYIKHHQKELHDVL